MFVCYALGPFGSESTTNILAARCHGNNHQLPSVVDQKSTSSEEFTQESDEPWSQLFDRARTCDLIGFYVKTTDN